MWLQVVLSFICYPPVGGVAAKFTPGLNTPLNVRRNGLFIPILPPGCCSWATGLGISARCSPLKIQPLSFLHFPVVSDAGRTVIKIVTIFSVYLSPGEFRPGCIPAVKLHFANFTWLLYTRLPCRLFALLAAFRGPRYPLPGNLQKRCLFLFLRGFRYVK
jgi:hypothetical protein